MRIQTCLSYCRDSGIASFDNWAMIRELGRIRWKWIVTASGWCNSVDDQIARRGSKAGLGRAPDVWCDVNPSVAEALGGLLSEMRLMITWLHRAKRDVLKVHPRSDPKRQLAGVFATLARQAESLGTTPGEDQDD
jgi:hypothetical protein